MPIPALAVGERKHVTILFADVRGSTEMIRGLDPEEVLARLDPVVLAAAQAVTRFGGIVNEIQGDGIMALFGAPTAAEDHPVRACLAAAALLKNLPRDIEMRVGIHSGEVVVRPSGRDASDYAAIGPAVYFAKRIEQSAEPGTARLSEETALRTRGYVDVRPLGPIQAKGWDEPAAMFELISATDRPSWQVRSSSDLSPFIGRELELGALSSAMVRAGLGRAQAVAVVADAGLGKSRLVHEFLHSPPARGVRVLHAAAAAHAHDAPFHVAAELMRSWIGALPADDRAALDRRLSQAIAIGDAREVDEPAVRSLLDLPLADPAAWEALDAAARRQRLLDASRRVVLRGALEQPRIVLVEDLHWVDEPSRALLDTLVASAGAARLLVLATTRPEHRPDWSARSYGIEMRLAPLDAEQSDTLLRTLVGDGPALAGLRRRVVDGAEGTPLFLEEIARSLRESGAVTSQPSRVLSVGADQVSIPASVQAIVASRMDRLAPAPRALLLTASVLGKDFRIDVLRQVSRLPELDLQSGLQALEAAEFLYETSPGTGAEYTFKHAVTQSVAYEAMLRAERRVLHARAFRAIQSVAGDRVEEWTERLCEHACAGELWEQTVHFGTLAGDRARARYAWREAIRYSEAALSALDKLPQDRPNLLRGLDLRGGLRGSLATIGEWERGAAVAEEATALALKLGDELRAAQWDGMACTILTSLGQIERAIELARRGHAVATRTGHVPTLQSVSFGLGQAHWFRGDFAEAKAVLTARLDDARGPYRTASAGTSGNAALMSFVCLSKSHAMLGEFDEAHALAAEAVALSDETRQPYDLAYAPIAAGFAFMLQEDHAAAIAVLEPGLDVVRNAGVTLLFPSIARYLGRSYAAAGRYDDADRLLSEALDITRRQHIIGLTAWCSTALAHLHLATESPAADAVVAQATALSLQHGYKPVLAICLRLTAACHALRGEWTEATERYRVACGQLEQLGMAPELAVARRGLAAALERAKVRATL